MALVKGKVLKINSIFACLRTRSLSTDTQNIKKSVFISQSNDIYTNLALEDWLYKNFDFTNHHVLLFTKNDPCVLIGINQNPWVESNVQQLKTIAKTGVRLARRNGHGPAVYQDHGNVNLTFFTHKNSHNTSYNTEIMKRALFRNYELKARVVQGQDIMLRNKKVTDTATFIGDENAYQQSSLLVNVDKNDLQEVLKTESPVKPQDTFKYMNLVDENYRVTIDGIISGIGWEYMRTSDTLKDGGNELVSKQGGFHMINPTDQWFPGLTKIREDLANWDWTFGKTPKFTLNRSFPVPKMFMQKLECSCPEINITMIVENARIKDVTMFVPPGLSTSGFSGKVKVLTNLKGRKFSEDALKSLEDYFKTHFADDKDRFVSDCVKKVMMSV